MTFAFLIPVLIETATRFIVWTEGADGKAGDSYDDAANVIHDRMNHRGMFSR